MPIFGVWLIHCHYVIVAWEGHTRLLKMIPKFTVVSHKQMKFLLQNKAPTIPTENKVDYLLVNRTRYIGTKCEVQMYVASIQIE